MPGFGMKKSKRGGGKVSSSWNSCSGLIGDQADPESVSSTGGMGPALTVGASRGGGGFFGGRY